jgi:quercetin dioxygenase-like cupin family protein
MAEAEKATGANGEQEVDYWTKVSAYDKWIESTGVPVHRGYFIEDLRTLQLGRWDERDCDAAFMVLAGQEGVSEARVTEIGPGKSLPPLSFGLDEVVYVADGRGLTTIWLEGKPKKTFEWQKHSMFLVPRGHHHQHVNAQGNRPARLLHYNYLPIAMEIVPDPRFYFQSGYRDERLVYGQNGEFYSEAKAVQQSPDHAGIEVYWRGNFFPDMKAWDKLVPHKKRGAGGHTVRMGFPNSQLSAHMSVFPARTYKKGHRHGPGRIIVIPAGEGYSIMWLEGKEKVVVPWHESSVFTPPDRWFHQHFNLGATPARYLALHPPAPFHGRGEKVEDRAKDQIEYCSEEPWIRQKFEEELAKRGLKSQIPDEAYRIPDYEWEYEE